MRRDISASKKYWFVWDEEIENPCAFEGFLFNDSQHLALQPCPQKHSYYLVRKHDELVYARYTIFVEGVKGFSPYKSSFGSIEFSNKIFFELLLEYWQAIEKDLATKGIKDITIKNYPVCYHRSNSYILSFLYAYSGFKTLVQELNFYIRVDSQDYRLKLHENERKKLNKWNKKAYEFRKELKPDIQKVYQLIAKTRERKNYPVTLSLEELNLYFENFPENFEIFTISHQEEWAALCVTIRVNSKILYTFYGADNESFRKESPLVLLHYHLYKLAQKEGIEIIDLGIGSSQGVPNDGLIRFKEKLGGKPDLKWIVRKINSNP